MTQQLCTLTISIGWSFPDLLWSRAIFKFKAKLAAIRVAKVEKSEAIKLSQALPSAQNFYTLPQFGVVRRQPGTAFEVNEDNEN